ncbi:hypothetical protein Pmani_011391 [Petrolisthes manimaculis]|uniref:Uncharacterized protein n=1 Tax=Petrolisthes manimaculis TaxID=1843537 RepID=A0AAE1Q324_9EUCA|nr:hypothetical protein Pmani_011391 [Petrolisthes manimaculis]
MNSHGRPDDHTLAAAGGDAGANGADCSVSTVDQNHTPSPETCNGKDTSCTQQQQRPRGHAGGDGTFDAVCCDSCRVEVNLSDVLYLTDMDSEALCLHPMHHQ